MTSLNGTALRQSSFTRLTRSLSAAETWGFGLTGHIIWINVAPSVHEALGFQAIYVWIPATLFGMLLNYQVKRLGSHFMDVAGGTPNYATRLLKEYPWIARYAAIGYFFSWVSVLPINAIVLTDLISVNLNMLGIACPEGLLKVGFTLLPFVVAFSGTRALSILHLFFVIPAIGLLLAFCLQGLGWLALSPASPGFFPSDWTMQSVAPPSFFEWAKWFLFVSYASYACESASAFVADSRKPKGTLRFLGIAAWLMPCIYLGGSWVLLRLSTGTVQENHFLSLLTAAQPFWGNWAALIITFLLAADCLLCCATVVSNCPRMLHQLALDEHLAPVFAVVSKRGVLGPALTLTLGLSLLCLIRGNVAETVVVGNVGWFVSIMAVHLGLWVQRHKPEGLLPWVAIALFGLESIVVLVGGIAWGWQAFLLGLAVPLVILAIDGGIRLAPFGICQPEWWIGQYKRSPLTIARDSVVVQVTMLIVLLCAAMLAGWQFRALLDLTQQARGSHLIVVLLMLVAFGGVAIACWTSLPQVVAMAEARESAEYLFTIAQDGIVVVDETGVIRQANPAAIALFGLKSADLIGHPLSDHLTELAKDPAQWKARSEQRLASLDLLQTLEVSISDRDQEDRQEYVVILRDITERHLAEESLRQSEGQLRQQTQQLEEALRYVQQTQSKLVQSEKMSSLGQLVAGIAHEINNPVNFISGNLSHADQYTQDLLGLMKLYQQKFPDPGEKILTEADTIDVQFILEDLPRMLKSMKVGADRIRQIVVSLRNFSRTDESAVKEVNIHDGIEGTLMILQSRLKAKGDRPDIQIIKDYGKLPLVECYAGQLNQVFMNLISNAIDALEESPQFSMLNSKVVTTPQHLELNPQNVRLSADVEASKVQNAAAANKTQNISYGDATRTKLKTQNSPPPPTIRIHTELSPSKHIIIRIADNGCGIPETVQRRLFDPFFTTKPVGKGTGLGLSISYDIVTEKHGGQIKCISAPGKGTEFMIEIPLYQSPEEIEKY
ncbi:MAG: PAS domain-containing sensor histidine kinase [Leptolyngbya sp.]|nr:MAG: PAS domain-containing sensor histidine kinase [Leptolyngbya sp.]